MSCCAPWANGPVAHRRGLNQTKRWYMSRKNGSCDIQPRAVCATLACAMGFQKVSTGVEGGGMQVKTWNDNEEHTGHQTASVRSVAGTGAAQ